MRFLAFVLLLFAGCKGYQDPEIVAENKATLSGIGDEVGILPDGRKIRRYRINMGAEMHSHWIYVVDNSVTVNHSQSQGKSTINSTQVIIDGITYDLVEKE